MYVLSLKSNLQYHMSSSRSGKDETNPALWLATERARWHYIIWLGLPAVSHKKTVFSDKIRLILY